MIGGSAEFIRRDASSLTGLWSPSTWPFEIVVSSTNNEYPVSLTEAKQMLPVNTDMHDPLVSLLIGATTGQVERYIGRDCYPKTRIAQYERVAGMIWLAYGPHGAVTSVEAVDGDGNVTAMTVGQDYVVEGIEFKRIRFIGGGAYIIRVTYVSGYAVGECPEEIRAAIQQELSLQYKNRQDPNAPERTIVNNLTVESRNLLLPFVRHVL